MNAEVFAKGGKKCRLWTRLLGQNLENLGDSGSAKDEHLVGEGKTDTSCMCSGYLFRHKRKASLCREENKGVWRLGKAKFKLVNFVRVFCICLYY